MNAADWFDLMAFFREQSEAFEQWAQRMNRRPGFPATGSHAEILNDVLRQRMDADGCKVLAAFFVDHSSTYIFEFARGRGFEAALEQAAEIRDALIQRAGGVDNLMCETHLWSAEDLERFHQRRSASATQEIS